MGLIVERTLQIDVRTGITFLFIQLIRRFLQVEIQVELEELEMENQADGSDVFPLDLFDVVLGQEGDESDSDSDSDSDGDLDEEDLSSDAASDSDSDEHEEAHTEIKQVQSMVSKLDNILEVIFKHLQRLHSGKIDPPLTLVSDPPSRTSTPTPMHPNSTPSTPTSTASPISPVLLQIQQQNRFTSLLSIFTRTILRTFKSRYTQFLLFWYSSFTTSFRDRFLGTIVSHALIEQDLPVVIRAAAASYVASYVSRAAFVDREETQAVVGVICEFLEAHLDAFDRISGNASGEESQSVEQHVVFYAAAQAVFLIFCFRWRDLMARRDDEDETVVEVDGLNLAGPKSWIPQLNVFQRVINSPLNPLKVRSLSSETILCDLKLLHRSVPTTSSNNSRAWHKKSASFTVSPSLKQINAPSTPTDIPACHRDLRSVVWMRCLRYPRIGSTQT